MGQYAFLQVIPREFRADADIDHDAVLGASYLDQVRGLGYTPVGQPELDWCEIDEGEAAREAVISGGRLRAGDWRVRAVVEVAENDPLPS